MALDLHKVIPFRVVEPTQADINKLHQLRSTGASGHVRRRVLDFMTECGKVSDGNHWSGKSYDSNDSEHMNEVLRSAAEAFTKEGDKKRSIWISEKDGDSDQDELTNLIKSRQQELKQEEEARGMSTAARSSSGGGGGGGGGEREVEQHEPFLPTSQRSSQRSRPTGKALSIDTDNNHNNNPNSSSTLTAPKEAVSPVRTRYK